MQCQEVQELLSLYFDGMLDPSTKKAVDLHVEGCPACRSDLENLTVVVGLVRSLPLIEPPAEFRQELRASLESLGRVRPPGLIKKLAAGRWSRIVAVAASLLLVVGVANAWLGPLQPTATDNNLAGQYEAGKAPAVNDIAGTARDSVMLGSPQVAYDFKAPADSNIVSPKNISIAGADDQKKEINVVGDPAGAGGGQALESPPRALLKMAQQPETQTPSLELRKADSGNDVSARGLSAMPQEVRQDLLERSVLLNVADKDLAIQEISNITQRNNGSVSALPEAGGGQMIIKVPDSQRDMVIEEIGRLSWVALKDQQAEKQEQAAALAAPSEQKVGAMADPSDGQPGIMEDGLNKKDSVNMSTVVISFE